MKRTFLSASKRIISRLLVVAVALQNFVFLAPVAQAAISDGKPASAVVGQGSYTTSTGTFTTTGLNGPERIAYDPVNKRLFVAADGYSRITVYNADPGSLNEFSEPAIAVISASSYTEQVCNGSSQTEINCGGTIGMALDATNQRLFVADEFGSRVMVFDVDPGSLAEFDQPAMAVIGQTSYIATAFSTTQNTMRGPTGVAYDPNNDRLFVADPQSRRVTVYNTAGLSEFNEPAMAVIGQANYTDRLIATSQTGLKNVYGIAYDSLNDRLFATDTGSHRVTVYDVDPGSLSEFNEPAMAVIGQANYTDSFSATSQTGLFNPMAASYDTAHERLFVADNQNRRILAYDASPGDLAEFSQPATYVIGQSLFTTSTASLTQAGMERPFDVYYDSADERLFVADAIYNRVLMYDSMEPEAPPAPSPDTTDNTVALSRIKVGVPSEATISFTLASPISTQLAVTFDAAFSGIDVSGAAAITPSSPDCMTNFTEVGGNGFTADKSACTGSVTITGVLITNPGTPGSYLVTWENDAPGFALVAIVDSDQINVNAQVSPSITFDLDADTSDTDTNAPYEVVLGSLSTSAVNFSDGSTVNSIWADLDTNASGGAVVTVLNANGTDGLVSDSVPTDTVPNAADTMATGTANYGLCVKSVSETSAGPLAIGTSYSGDTCDYAAGNDVEALSDTVPDEILDTSDDTIIGGRAEIVVNAAIDETTVSHTDYLDTLTFVATGTF